MKTAAIKGVYGYLPKYILDNEELSRMVDTSDEWIMSRVGIKTRHILKDEEGVGTSYLGAKAVEGLLKKTNTPKEEIELLILASATPDYAFPATSNIICDKVGIRDIISFDMNVACSGFINAIVTATQYIKAGTVKKAIVVGADKMSAIVDYTDRTTCALFGDGAGAVLLEASDEYGIQDHIIRTDGVGKKYLHQKAGGSVQPASFESVKNREHFIYQEGQTVFKWAVSKMADVSVEVMKRNNIQPDQLAWLVPHQANLRIIEAVAKRMGIRREQVMINIQKYGNTTSATIPLCLWEWEKQLKKGDNVILSAFGAGFSWGAIYLQWAYDGDQM